MEISDDSSVSLAWIAAPTFSYCWLFIVLVNSFFLAADEGLAPSRVGNCTAVCGWLRFS